ncbi:hypothetical protein FZ983_17690 [Azospirillum sp. B21]|uniref:patatin-like phospholipase family protein n=1 Tax=Azospirillum sp. B21 TaxID=2607496 RepID=UPI0011ECA051|nr:patatin-like phospholipase family protein [Azospirillum sp. B21]KAA0579146.1 hypothetical protein FZ983_17690 [Azospirillum sp. B21]
MPLTVKLIDRDTLLAQISEGLAARGFVVLCGPAGAGRHVLARMAVDRGLADCGPAAGLPAGESAQIAIVSATGLAPDAGQFHLDRPTIFIGTHALAREWGVTPIVVGPLTEDQSIDLLWSEQAGGAPSTGEREQLAGLAKRLGYWPLGLALAGRRIAEGMRSTSFDDAMAGLTRDLTTFGLTSLDDAADRRQGPTVAGAMRAMLAGFDWEERMGLAALARAAENETLSEADAAAATRLPVGRAAGLLARLHDLSLLERHGPGHVRLWTVAQAYFGPHLRFQGNRDEAPGPQRADDNPDVQEAKRLLDKGQVRACWEHWKLARRLKRQRFFNVASALFKALRTACHEHRQARGRFGATRGRLRVDLKLVQAEALCTYKDAYTPAHIRLDAALKLLREEAALDTTTDQETLGLAGAVYKNKWEIDGRREHLEASAALYLRGCGRGMVGPRLDKGYTAINAAFMLDLLAGQMDQSAKEIGISSEDTKKRVFDLRERIVRELGPVVEALRLEQQPDGWWTAVTLAEAHFGLGAYDDALYCLRIALGQRLDEWELESTARQLSKLADLSQRRAGGEASALTPAWETLCVFLREDVTAVRGLAIGKVGLALSGGGFRASLFHIGVLAGLAEMDVLRHVEVLSCVSGGSIIGAYYYLELRRLLMTKRDCDIDRNDYIALVKRIEKNFKIGIRHNIRTRVFTNFYRCLDAVLKKGWSRTNYLGDLYEKYLFKPIYRNWPRGGDLVLSNLLITPYEDPDFMLKLDNWRRASKVPVLLLNCTTLNTGHNWQFAATWMGEPPSGINAEIDASERLRRMYYEDNIPTAWKSVPLGFAVAASSGVPGLFPPLQLPGLYPGRTISLVDGGVHDNQGIAGLLEQDCAMLLVSDASGQLQVEKEVKQGLGDVLPRANDILMARVRDLQNRELEARSRGGLLRGRLFVHLMKDLESPPVKWLPGDTEGEAPSAELRAPADGGVTCYGMPRDIQSRLAGIRTDLDSFCDAEADTLMLSGYRMTHRFLPDAMPGLGRQAEARSDGWRFLAAAEAVDSDDPKAKERLLAILGAARHRLFKAFRIPGSLKSIVDLVRRVWWLVPIGITFAFFSSVLNGYLVFYLVGLVLLGAGLGVLCWIRRRRPVMEFLIGVLAMVFGPTLGALYLAITDGFYRRHGGNEP